VGEHKADLLSPADGYVIEFKNKRIVEIARTGALQSIRVQCVWIHKKNGETVKKGEPLITIFADKSWKLTNALKSAEKDYPLIVEGMLLERVQTFQGNLSSISINEKHCTDYCNRSWL